MKIKEILSSRNLVTTTTALNAIADIVSESISFMTLHSCYLELMNKANQAQSKDIYDYYSKQASDLLRLNQPDFHHRLTVLNAISESPETLAA